MKERKRKGEGPELTAEQLRLLAVKAHANAVELVSEAELLFEHKHYARCLFLSQIAGEELGKSFMALTLIPRAVMKKANWTKFWRRFRNHKDKAQNIHFFENFASPHELEHPDKIVETVSMMETGKMLSLYTEQIQEGPLAPSDWVHEQIAANALGWAKGRSPAAREGLYGQVCVRKHDYAHERIRGSDGRRRRRRKAEMARPPCR
jgi:AbiV family abortive infection protein